MRPLDIDDVVARLREHVGVEKTAPPIPASEMENLNTSRELLEEARSLNRDLAQGTGSLDAVAQTIGMPTPKHPSTRGRAAFGLMELMGSLFWWYTWRLKEAFGALIRALRGQGQQQSRINELILDSQAIGAHKVRSLQAIVDRLNADSTALKAEELRRSFEQIRTEAFAQWQAATAGLRTEMQTLAGASDLHARKFDELWTDLLAKHGAVCGSLDNEAAARQKLEGEVQRLRSDLESLRRKEDELARYNGYLRSELTAQQARVSMLTRGGKADPVEPTAAQTGGDCGELDALYVAFENVFRGSRDEIKQRQAAYLPLFGEREILRRLPVVDLGCGRGEWLELLRENGIEGHGVDVNQAMLDSCRELGLRVDKSDGLAYLKALPDSSVGAVTAFHVVEHMPFDRVMDLIDQSLRVLAPGGILILETPNPANVTVGSHLFYLDPTHLRPIPSAMLRFFVEARGFCDVHVRDLHADPAALRLLETTPVEARFNEAFHGPRDYAVVGAKPTAL